MLPMVPDGTTSGLTGEYMDLSILHISQRRDYVAVDCRDFDIRYGGHNGHVPACKIKRRFD